MTTTDKSPLTSILHDGNRCAGFTLKRGVKGVEGFDSDGRSIGLFADQAAAIAKIFTVFAKQAENLPSPSGEGKSSNRSLDKNDHFTGTSR